VKRIICICLIFILISGISVSAITFSSAEENVVARNEDFAKSSPEAYIYVFLTQEMELSTATACGILANIQAESNFDHTAVGDEGKSYGICQWHDPREGVGRWTALKEFCDKNGYDWETLDGQLYFLHHELSTLYPNTFRMIKNVTNDAEGAYSAAYDFCVYYEKPANPESKGIFRGNNAKVHFEKYHNRKKGDISGDKSVNGMDLLLMKKHILGIIKLTGADYLSADMNDDFKINGMDLLLLKKMILS